MRSSWISMYLIALWVVSLAADSFQELFMIREPPEAGGESRKVICVAEDDGAVLVLNTDLRYNSSTPCTDTEVSSPRDIAINLSTKEGEEHYWKITGNHLDPMGPVFDYRWKGFDELSFGMTNESSTSVGHIKKSTPIVFSVRGSEDIDILACKREHFSKSHCSGITIAARPKKTGLIKSSKVCQESKSHPELLQPIISEYEWRTFIFESTDTQMKIQAHDSDCVFVTNKTYVDTEVDEEIFLNSSRSGRARFHVYDYLLTTKKDAMLYTLIFEHRGQNICIELMVSLCSECELDVSIVERNGQDIQIGKIFGKRNSTGSKLPTWRFEKLEATLPYHHKSPIKLQISIRTNGNVTKGRWAINPLIRKCQPMDAMQVSSSSILRTQTGSEYVFPPFGCQKLSYTENHVVRTDVQAASNISSNLQNCLRGRISRSCTYQQEFWKSGTSFCDRSGCICAPGFTGSDCKQECGDGFYGYDCRESCDHCVDKTCGKTTGWCTRDCAYNHLPPSCKTKLEAPAVSNVDGTTAVLRLNYSADLSVNEIRDLHFQLKTGTRDWTIPETKSQNSSMFEFTVCGLVSETRYTVRAVMQAQTRSGFWIYIESPEKDFYTTTSVQPTVTDSASCPTAACTQLSDTLCRQDQVPDNPLKVRVISQGKGIVTLKWNHPSSTCEQITWFQVEVRFVKTNLQKYESDREPIFKNYTPSQDHPECTSNMNFDLLTSTLYNFSIKAINAHGPGEPTIALFQIPASVGFIGAETPQVIRNETFIELKIPAVVNATRNSRVKVIVKGPPPCSYPEPSESLKKLVNMIDSEKGWIAMDSNVTENRPENAMIGNHPNDNSSGACSLDPKETYVIVIVLEADKVDVLATLTPPPTTASFYSEVEKSNSWIAILLILLICIFLLFIWRRKFWKALKRMRLQNLVMYSQVLINFVKSRFTWIFQQPLVSPTVLASVSTEIVPSEIAMAPGVVRWSRYSYSVNIEDFEDYVKDAIAEGVLKSQFMMFPRGLVKPSTYGSLPENKPKNRYRNIIPYDDSRVILNKLPGDPYSDYINANYVQGFDGKNSYIAAQGPKPQTVVDFWRMIWQEEALIICMLANVIEGDKVKCEQYWPEFGASATFGDIVVVTEKHEIFADYTFRTFRVSCKEETRKIEHLHYTGWPDHSVPTHSKSVITYLKKLQTISVETRPIIVHCSAGVGRTGTIILLDICLRLLATNKTLDVLAELKKIRSCRLNMVDNELQYVFVHIVLTEYLVSRSTEVECNNDLPQAIKRLKEKLPEHMERLRNTVWQDQVLRPQVSARPAVPEQLVKNRFPKLAPAGNSGLVYLTRYPRYASYSDYISAVIVDGARVKKQYVASQLPLPSTLSDFWRLITEQEIQHVIILQQPDLRDPTCCEIISGEESFNPVPFINVQLTSSSGSEQPSRLVELLLTDTSETTPRTQRVTVLTCTGWGPGKYGKPPSPNELIELWTVSKNIHREEGPALVLCHDGVTGCGLYLALSFMLERMAEERKCDVIFAVQAVRQSRAEFVQSEEQFVYLYDAATEYFESFETYANFD